MDRIDAIGFGYREKDGDGHDEGGCNLEDASNDKIGDVHQEEELVTSYTRCKNGKA
jgi:hypothetical protein